jgi:hypothetical protein
VLRISVLARPHPGLLPQKKENSRANGRRKHGEWSPNRLGRLKPMISGQSSGHFSREMGKVSVRHERYFFTISKQKPGKRYFCEKKILEPQLTQINADF